MIQPLQHVELRERLSSLEKTLVDHRRLEAVLSQSVGQKEAILDHLNDPIAYHDRAFRVVWANEAACRFMRIRREKVIGRRCYEAWEGRSEPCEGCPMESAGESGSGAERTDAGGRTWRIQGYAVCDQAERPIGLVEVRKNVTELTAGRQALEKERRFTETLIHGSPAYIVIVDGEGRTLLMNQAMLDALGYEGNEVEGREYLSSFVSESDRGEVAAFFDEIASQNRAVQSETRISAGDGREWLVQWEGRPVFKEDGQLDFLFLVGINVTETRALEAQLMRAQKMEAFGTLAGGIAHDFNNMLQAIRGYSDLLLLKKKEGDPDYQALREIQNAAGSASELTDRLMTFSRNVKSDLQPVDLNRRILRIHRILERTIPRMIALDLDLADDLDAVNADPGQIEQLLMNLSLNARDAMDQGGTLRIETRNVCLDASFCEKHVGVTPGRYVRVLVTDTGHGIAPEILNHIFEPFFTTKESGKGTGLGLSMVYGIVKNNGGCIACNSEPGRGTDFHVYFPAMDAKAESEHVDFVEALSGGTETVLLVDDERNIRELGREILTKFGYRVLSARDGEEAISLYEKDPDGIDLIILDLIMPGKGGKKCLETIVDMDPEANIIISSGCFPSGEEKDALQGQARGFIQKPYDIARMLGTVRRVLDECTAEGSRPPRPAFPGD
jgi:PAS domain S-box-containing protein